MPEHTIPPTLVDHIRAGRATLVIGVGIGGIPSWKQILERMNDALRERGRPGDDAASRDVDKLLHKASLVRAAGFLGRTLGEDQCDAIVKQAWGHIRELPPIALALARLPFKQVWTTFPGDVFERAMNAELPEEWPTPRVVTWERAGDIDRRRRTLLKILGDFDSYVVTPRSTRAMLSKADALREHVRGQYARGSLVFVGFRFGDPDLAALLDRVFGMFEPPETDHYLVASGVGPVTLDELQSEHDMKVINLPGKGTDDRATEALLEWMGELERACAEAGVHLRQTRPDDDDIEGWIAVLEEDAHDLEAAEKLASIEARAQDSEDWERLVEVLIARSEVESSQPVRAGLLRKVADLFETRIGDLPRAFTALTAALREDPSDTDALDHAEKLAEETGGWAELVGDMAQLAGDLEDAGVAAATWARLGRWYHKKLDHHDYAVAAFRTALKHDPTRADAHAGLAELFRVQQRWAEMADALEGLAEHEEDEASRSVAYLALGDLQETQLGSAIKAMDSYQKAFDLDPDSEEAIDALERLYRKSERWGKLARVLERRAELLEAAGEAQRAAVTRHELATMRAEKLGDMEGAIARHEATLKTNPRDLQALKALEDLYDKVGRTPDFLRTLERLAEVAVSTERPAALRRLAVEAEERGGDTERAARAYEQVLELEPNADDALVALQRLYRAESRWDELLGVMARHAQQIKVPAARADVWAAAGEVYEHELSDPHRAVEAHQNALAAQGDRRDSLRALARLYQRIEAHARALDVIVQHAKLSGDKGADLWVEAAEVATEALGDPEVAMRHLERALAIDPDHQQALVALSRVHQGAGQWASAAQRLEEAAGHTTDRRARIELLLEAAMIYDDRLDQGEKALEMWQNVLRLDPEHEVAGRYASDRLCMLGRFQEALPHCEMLVRLAPEDDRLERARREAELARVCAGLGMLQKAIKHYRGAMQADPGAVEAAVGLSAALHAVAALANDPDRWKEAQQAQRDLLVKHKAGLADGQLVELWHRMGVAAKALGEPVKAEESFRRALERDPVHVPSLEALVELASARGDWKTVVSCKRELMEEADEDTKVRLLEEVGDICREKIKDAEDALGAYLEAIQLKPGSHTLLHKALEVYTERKQWRRAIDTLAALAETESDDRRRGRYHYTAGVIARDELVDLDLALEQFNRALDDDATSPKAFEAIDSIVRGRQDWKNLARAYRKQLKRLGEEAPAELLLPLWTKLGEVCLDHLDDTESAVAALEVAVSLDPDALERHEQLAELYLELGESRRRDAIDELTVLLQADPERDEAYHLLFDLCREEGDLDKAYCAAQALVILRKANEAEQAFYEAQRPQHLLVSKRRLTEELWQKAILHAREDRHVNAIWASMVGMLATSTAQPPAAYNLAPQARVDLTQGRPVARMVKYASNVLGIEPDPALYVLADNDPLRVANTLDRGGLSPALLAGQMVDRVEERELAFELGKRLAYLRPDRYVTYAMTTQATLEAAFQASLAAAGVRPVEEVGPDAARLAERLVNGVPEQVLMQVGAIARKMQGDFKNGAIASWRTATDLTANRVGLILCNDLATAAKKVATETAGVSTLPARERLRDLLAYSVSEGYSAVRRHLGLALEGKRSTMS